MPASRRPLSPHLQVYRPQLTSILSISHRIAGIALAAGSLLLVWQLVMAASGPASFASFQGFVGSWFGLLLLAAWSAAFFFHLANGIRHLVWDVGYGFELATAYRSGFIVLVAAGALTLVTWIAVLIVWRT